MESLIEEIEASLYRSQLIIEEESLRMYFYPQSRGGSNMNQMVVSPKDASASQNGTINTLRLKKYWNLFPKKKSKKCAEEPTTNSAPHRWSSIKDRYGTVSGTFSYDTDIKPTLRATAKSRGTLISPWENYSGVPDVILEEGGPIHSYAKSSGMACTCGSHQKVTPFGSVRTPSYQKPCSCCSGSRRNFGTTRANMGSSNRKSILKNGFPTQKLMAEVEDDELLDSSSSYSRVGRYVKNNANKNTSTYGTTKSRKSILECDVNPYELVRYQSKSNSGDGVTGDVTACDLEDDDLNLNAIIDEDTAVSKPKNEEKKGKKSKGKSEESRFSIYSKAEKGTLRIGGRAMAFHLKRERKMPKASPPQKPPRRSVSVPDIRVAEDEKPVILSIKPLPEPTPDYSNLKRSSKMMKQYDSMTAINRASRTPSPTRKTSTPFQNSSIIYGLSPLRRPKVPPPPPPPPPPSVTGRKFCLFDEGKNEETVKMETISEDSSIDCKIVGRRTSFNADFRSILKRGPSEKSHDTCSETSSSAYGSMNSQNEIKREVKSILKKSSCLDTSGLVVDRKKSVKFKSSSDNSLLIEDINEKLNIADDFESDEFESDTDGFLSVSDCTLSPSNVRPTRDERLAKDSVRNRNIVFRNSAVHEKAPNVMKPVDKNLDSLKKSTNSDTRSWNIRNNSGTNPVPKAPSPPPSRLPLHTERINLTENETKNSLPARSQNVLESKSPPDAVEFPDFDPDDDWLSSENAAKISVPKNVNASPTTYDVGCEDLVARGMENSTDSAKVKVVNLTCVELVEGPLNCDVQEVVPKNEIISQDPIYDTIKSGTITCTYISNSAIDLNPTGSDSFTKSDQVQDTCKSTFYVHASHDDNSCYNLAENSEIDQLYDDIAGVSEPIYEELPGNMNSQTKSPERKSMFEGASKTEILSILNNAKKRVLTDSESSLNTLSIQENSKYVLEEDGFDENTSDPGIGLEDIQKRGNHPNRLSNLSNLSDSSTTSEETSQADSNEEPHLLELITHNSQRRRRGSAEIERNDSGVGSETSKPSKVRRHSNNEAFSCEINSDDHTCEDCDQQLGSNYDLTESFDPFICDKCHKRRMERKEIITEIVETEIKYGNDLKILKEEFYKPMEVAGLLLFDQLQSIFINLNELQKMNAKFVEKLTDALEIANEQGDEDYLTLSVGKLFLDSTPMLHGFETYCVQQSAASVLLNNLVKDKELLRIFLCVSQMENTLLRRMNLHAFLMVPVQRVTKYPLLLNRLYKVTPHHHKDRDALKEAQKKIELHLAHINLQTKGVGTTKIWRKISNISIAHRRNTHVEEVGNIKLRTMALELLQWNREEVKFMKEGRLMYTQPSECIKRNKSVKFTPVNALLVTLGGPDSSNIKNESSQSCENLCKATLLLVKEKGNRLVLVREQLPLKDCVISTNLESSETFEVHLVTSKDFFLCKSESIKETKAWAEELKKHARDQGRWRQRRNALANIMINGLNKF